MNTSALKNNQYHTLPLKKQNGTTIMEFILYSVLALSVIAGVAVFALRGNSNSNVLGMAKNLAGVQTQIKQHWGGSYGTGSLNAALITDGTIIPADWTITSPSTITGQGGAGLVFTGVTTTFTATVSGMTKAYCQSLLANTSAANWNSVVVNVGTGTSGVAITTWPITELISGASTACGAANTGLTATFTSR